MPGGKLISLTGMTKARNWNAFAVTFSLPKEATSSKSAACLRMKAVARAFSRETACIARDLGDVATSSRLPGDGGDGHVVSVGERRVALKKCLHTNMNKSRWRNVHCSPEKQSEKNSRTIDA